MSEFFWRQQEIIRQSYGQKAFGSNTHHKTLKYVPELATVRFSPKQAGKVYGFRWMARLIAGQTTFRHYHAACA
jgi:hypothetical protein